MLRGRRALACARVVEIALNELEARPRHDREVFCQFGFVKRMLPALLALFLELRAYPVDGVAGRAGRPGGQTGKPADDLQKIS